MALVPAKPVAIFGCGGHARSAADVLLDAAGHISFFYDQHARDGEQIFGLPCVNDDSVFSQALQWHIALGDSQQRMIEANRVIESGGGLVSIFSPKAYIGREAALSKGVFVGHGAHVGPLANVGQATIINTGAVVEHEVLVGKGCHISINAVVAGRAQLGDHVFIGAGAVVRDAIKICNRVTVGVGAVVVKDITEPGVYVGIPAKKISGIDG